MAKAGTQAGLRARMTRRGCLALALTGTALGLAACAGGSSNADRFTSETPRVQMAEQPASPPPPANGQVRVALILPLSAQGNAGVAAQSMKNADEMALAEFKQPNVQLLVKDDAGNPQTAQAVAQQAVAE